MAFQLAALIVQGNLTNDPRSVFDRLGFSGAIEAGTVPFIEATSPQTFSRCIGSNGEWTMITDAMPFVSYSQTAPIGSLWSGEVSKFLREASADGKRSFGFIMSKLSSNYGFSLHVDGVHQRSLLAQMGNILVSEGKALKAENVSAQVGNKELAIFQLMEELKIPFHSFESVRFNYFAFERNG